MEGLAGIKNVKTKRINPKHMNFFIFLSPVPHHAENGRKVKWFFSASIHYGLNPGPIFHHPLSFFKLRVICKKNNIKDPPDITKRRFFFIPLDRNVIIRVKKRLWVIENKFRMPKNQRTLTKVNYNQALEILKKRDPDIKGILSRLGSPPFWCREPGFPTLIHIILEQQVSLASAKATFIRLQQMIPVLTPETFLRAAQETLRQAGFSRQKARYGQLLAKALQDGSLSLNRLKNLEDEEARNELLKVTGIGPWTADIYLLIALRRPNIWPLNDIALNEAVQKVKNLVSRPSPLEMEKISQTWIPWRAVAARIFWYHYLGGKTPSGF
jgi:DNA-3-methyladenine glycosylase II